MYWQKGKTWLVMVMVLAVPIFLQQAFKVASANDEVRALVLTNAGEMLLQTQRLEHAAQRYKAGKESLYALRQQLQATRKAYKGIEFLVEYFNPTIARGSINGAPLYHLDPYLPRPVIHEPNGLQRLDELVFSEEAGQEKVTIAKLSAELASAYAAMHRHLMAHPIIDHEVFEASRLQLIRIFTLGVTGFDTPGSANGLEEASVSLSVLKKVMQTYQQELPASEKSVGITIDSLFMAAMDYLDENPDFEKFDRFEFLKSYIDPLFASTLDFHLALKLETIYEVTSLEQSWNYYSRSIFAKDFLNPYYFSGLHRHAKADLRRELGERLFYETQLSGNGLRSCASCHHPEKAFTDGLPQSAANKEGEFVSRNAPSLINAVFSKRFFWDMRAFRFEDQMEHVIISPKEFNTSYNQIFEKLRSDEQYNHWFAEAYPDIKNYSPINKSTLSDALSHYLMGLVDFDSDFDRAVRGEKANLDPKVKDGFNLFMGKAACGTCHFAPTFAGLVPPLYQESESEVLGVLKDPNADVPQMDADPGRMANRNPMEEVWFYENSFKTVTVRNVSLTAPYFHNGAYQNLETLIDFYDHGGGAGLGLDVPHQTLPADSLHLSEYEKEALITFMHSLEHNSDFSSYLPLGE